MAVWSGLGMGIYSTSTTAQFDEYVDTLKSFGILDIRVDIPDYQDTAGVARSKAAVIRAVAKGMRVVWGVSSNSGNNPDYTITSTNWADFSAAILSAAQWSQDNGVYEFQLGNEEESHNDNTTITDATLRDNFKTVATAAQAIFTRGNISYTIAGNVADAWIALGRGDIDIIALNAYRGGSGSFNNIWIADITKLLAEYGASHFELTEFSLSYTSLADYSTNTDIQMRELATMQKKIRDLGVTRAFFFVYNQSDFGVISSYGAEPRLIWNVLTTNGGRKWFI